jgi:hypothetical protein
MSIIQRWASLVAESGGFLPSELKRFQLDTQTMLERGTHTLVSVPTGQGKSLIQLNGARLMGGGECNAYCPTLGSSQQVALSQVCLSGCHNQPFEE